MTLFLKRSRATEDEHPRASLLQIGINAKDTPTWQIKHSLEPTAHRQYISQSSPCSCHTPLLGPWQIAMHRSIGQWAGKLGKSRFSLPICQFNFSTVAPERSKFQSLSLLRPLKLQSNALPLSQRGSFAQMQSAIRDNDPENLRALFHGLHADVAASSGDHSILFCNLYLEGLIKMSRVDEALTAFRSFIEQGRTPSLATFEILIDGLLNHWNEKEALSLQQLMEADYRLKPGVGIHNYWITFYLKNHQLDKAKQLYERMQCEGIKPNLTTFRCFMKYYLSVSDFGAAEELKRTMNASGIKLDTTFYNTIIRCLCKKRAFSDAESLLCEMKANGCVLTLSTYRVLIEGYASLRDHQRISKLFEEMKAAGIEPDISLYNTLLALYSDNDTTNRARRLLLEMNERGLRFNAFTYAALLYGLIKQHKFVEACEMISKMDRSGTSLSASTYASLVDLCCEKKFHAGVHFIRTQMRANNVTPNLAMYTALVRLNLRCLRYGSVEGLLREMESTGTKPNAVLYGILLDHFVEHFDLPRIQKLLTRMQSENISITSAIYDGLMRAFYVYCRYAQGGYLFRVQIGQYTDRSSAAPLNHEMFRLEQGSLDIGKLKSAFEATFNLPFRLSIHVFNDLMLVFLRLMRFDEFFECFSEIQRNNLRPNLLTYTLLIKARLYLGQPEAARSLLPEMQKWGLKPTILQCALIFHVFCRNIQTTQAEAFLSEIINHYGLVPNHVFYASLLYTYSKSRDYAKVFSVFDRLEKAGFKPDTETSNFVLSSLYEIGEYAEANRFFEKLVRQGIRRNTHTYYIMADRLVLQGDSDRFLERLVDCLSPGNSVDAMPFNRLLNNYYRSSQYDVLRKVMSRMIEYVIKFDDGTLPFVSYIFADYLSENNWQEAELILRKAVVDYDPSNYQVKSIVDVYRGKLLQAPGEQARLEAFDRFLDTVYDLKRLWILPSPLLTPERWIAEPSQSSKADIASIELNNLLHDFVCKAPTSSYG
jgi:pentatricopeptide repeat protein